MARTATALVLSCALTTALAGAAHADMTQERYRACLDQVSANAEEAYEDAMIWRAQGGGWPAEHCASLAQIAQGWSATGAARLRANAEGATQASDMSRAIMFGQAGDAFLYARQFDEAAGAFARGLDFAPSDAGLARGLADAAYARGDLDGAVAAADAALDINPGEPGALGVRAAARLEQGAFDAAADDIATALSADPENIELLVLRGRLNEARRTGQIPERN
ncbi:tetratricopeptide repeat protein [Alkalicaulis satelles]|uniref:Tetratricopeptide repeat protein n=1 Tax=Alkalicaulis satelles TaxID=2609175 RepID=A0A5M6ZGF6_9PROT|nr:tetratricopeptide repeat protein [Alkalicaulis satelles]KAA5803832.1 tetratricopeptide repeat protein [Alkalicaulis satelles]